MTTMMRVRHGSARGDVREPYSYRHDPDVPAFPDNRPIIVFDGLCALCAGFARFVLRHDLHGTYRLLPAQSPLGRALYIHYGLDPDNYTTNILLSDGVPWFKSEASICMAEGLGPPWSLVAAACRILPRPIRDRLYGLLARNRLRLFGRRETCFMSDRSYEDRFLA